MFSHLVGLICCFSSRIPPLKPINIKFYSWLKCAHSARGVAKIFSSRIPYPTLLIRPGYSAFLASSQTYISTLQKRPNIRHLPCMTFWVNQCFLEVSRTPQVIFVVSLSITSSAVVSTGLANFASSVFSLYL